jgi:very-short-patch-repair endonuclease
MPGRACRTTLVARGLRRRQTDAELKLWRYLRSRHIAGAKFRRQHPVGPYIVDFAYPECRLVIELDGSQHGGATDRERDRRLAARGWRVLRFWDNDALKETEGVLRMVFAAVNSPSPPPSPVQGRGRNPNPEIESHEAE